MNKLYRELIKKSEKCEKKAISLCKKREFVLAAFYKNASIGFKERALSLEVER